MGTIIEALQCRSFSWKTLRTTMPKGDGLRGRRGDGVRAAVRSRGLHDDDRSKTNPRGSAHTRNSRSARFQQQWARHLWVHSRLSAIASAAMYVHSRFR